MQKITNVKVLPKYNISLEYSNGVKGVAVLYHPVAQKSNHSRGDKTWKTKKRYCRFS